MLALALASVGAHAASQEPSGNCPPALMDHVARVSLEQLDSAMKRLLIPGAQFAASCGGALVFSHARGLANVENGVQMTVRTGLRIGSVSKTLTTAALAGMVEERRIDLDRSIQHYLRDLPFKPPVVTARQLAGHLAGVRHYDEDHEMRITRHYESVTESLSLFAGAPLRFRPGEDFLYSSYGYTLLSAVLEAADGRPFLEVMRARVIDPAGMSHTVEDDVHRLIPGRGSHYHVLSQQGLTNSWLVDASYKWAAGGYLSTAEDLVRFASRLLGGELVRPATLALLFASQRLTDGTTTGYALGWMNLAQHLEFRTARGDAAYADRVRGIARRSRGVPLLYHSGSAMGGEAHLLVSPCRRVAVALVWNRDEISREQLSLAFEAWRALVDSAPAVPGARLAGCATTPDS